MSNSSQLELKLSYLVPMSKCKHPALRYDGLQPTPGGKGIPLYTCFHPHRPHCGGTRSTWDLGYTNSCVKYNGQYYLVKTLADWYGTK